MMGELLLAACLLDSLTVRDVRIAPGEVLRVTSTGAGSAVVFVPNIFGAAYGFRHLLKGVSRAGYHAIVIEPLGTGFSSYPRRADYSLTAQSERVMNVLARERIQGAVIVGYGVGVSIALRLAYRHPEHVLGVVGIDGGAIESAGTPGIRKLTSSGPLLRLLMTSAALRRHVRHFLIEDSADSNWVTSDVVAHYTAGPERDLGAMIDAWQGMVAAREPETLHDHLPKIQQPVRLLVGGVDHRGGVQPAEVRELCESLPDFAVDTVAGAGGPVHEEQPDAVVDVILAMVRGKSRTHEAACGGGPVR